MEMKRVFCLVFLALLFCTFSASATHIVGGEFELQHLKEQNYLLRLILYNDDVNGSANAIDGSATVHIWRKRDNSPVTSFYLPRSKRQNVDYTNPDCVIPQLRTSKVIYEATVYLNPEVYNDEQGYYVTYERCCRNHIIDNIVRPEATGQTFYLEFPPVMMHGEPFINSSPVLFPPLSDFARVGYPFYFDFKGTDPDGDSIVYSLVTPLAGYSSDTQPLPANPSPAPYPEVIWGPGYSNTNSVPGSPALRINKNGFLQVTASQQGLYVFSVLAQEFRKGKKIGEVRRDFQLMAYDLQGVDHPPVLIAEKANGEIFRDKISIDLSDFPQPEGERCITFKVKDEDIQQEDGFSENLRFRVIPQNFQDANRIELTLKNGQVTKDNPELSFQMCLPECPPVFDEPYRFLVVAYDDICSLPMTDTVEVVVSLPIPLRHPAQFLSIPDSAPTRVASHVFPTVMGGGAYDFVLEGFDVDGDALVFKWKADGFDAEQWGFSFQLLEEELDGEGVRKVRYGVHWDATCATGRNFGERDTFNFLFSLDDESDCDQHGDAVYSVNFSIKLPGNLPPEVLTSLNGYRPVADEVVLEHEVQFLKGTVFTVQARDEPQDYIFLRAQGEGFDLADWGMSFHESAGNGTVAGLFSWSPECGREKPGGKDEFIINFISRDAGECKTGITQILRVKLKLVFHVNEAPELSAQENSGGAVGRVFEVITGETLSIWVHGVDANRQDGLTLVLTDVKSAAPSFSYTWQNAQGTGGAVSSLLTFTAGCELLQGKSEAAVTFKFRLNDDPCYNKKADTLTVRVLLKDRPQPFEQVKYVNFFSPDGDRCNQYFEIYNLPADGCYNRFEYVRVYNRWGKLLFESNDRHFKWDGGGHSAGTYYYLLKYTDMTYRSPLALMMGEGGMDDSGCP